MDSPNTVANLGTPLGADLGSIERQLAAFWRSASAQPDEPAVIKACSSNLIVITPGRQQAEALPPVLADVAEWHPCRSLVAFQEAPVAGSDSLPMQGWILVQCRSQVGGGPQVCSEVITIGARRESAGDLSNTLVSLLVPDLPVFLYWRSPRAADWLLVETLSRFTDLLLIDSDASPSRPEDRARVLGLFTKAPKPVGIRDLSWSRLTAWRDLIAQFFDSRAALSQLKELVELEISFRRASAESWPGYVFLLAGWLTSRLGWQQASVERKADESVFHMRGDSGEVVVRLTRAPERTKHGGLKLVRFLTRNGSSFSVTRADENSCLSSVVVVPSMKPVVHTVPCPSLREADLLIGELSLQGEDTGFRAALAAAMALEKDIRY